MPTKKANTHGNRTFRGFEASPWTDAARIALRKRATTKIPSRIRTPIKSDNENQAVLDPDTRRRWIEEVEGRCVQHARDLLKIQESPRMGDLAALPIENKGQVSHAYEFFRNVYVPTNSTYRGFKTYCQVVLQDAMLFEQMMAYVLAMQNMDKAPKRRMTAPALYHSNRSVAQLRQRLQATCVEDRTSDAVVMTILLLIAFYVTCGDLEPWSLHMKALRRVTAVRGGSENLGWEGFIHTKVCQIEAAWTTFEARKTDVQQTDTELTYPAHPFSPALCHQISKLPTGFQELALRHRLSLQFISVLRDVLHRMEDDKAPSSVAVTSIMEDVITHPELTALERALAIAVISCCVAKARTREGVPPSVEISRQLHARSFPFGRGMYNEGSLEEASFDWAALVLRATTNKDSTAWNWADQRINSGSTGLALGARSTSLQKDFLEIPV